MIFVLLASLSAFAADGVADILTYEIGPGDLLYVQIVGQPDMTGEARVDGTGSLLVPQARSVGVTGLTLDEARVAITSTLADGYLRNPQVLVDIREFASKKIAVTGGVKTPDGYSLEGGRSRVSDVLMRAGGLVDPAAPRAEIWRDVQGVRQILRIDLQKLRSGDAVADIELVAGDHLYVPEVDQVYVDGQVAKPGGVAFHDNMTLTEAIAQAGSVTSAARRQGIIITRDGTQIRVNFQRVQTGKDADVALKPKDQIYIPESVF